VTAIQRHDRCDRVEALQRACDEHPERPETGGMNRGARRKKPAKSTKPLFAWLSPMVFPWHYEPLPKGPQGPEAPKV
jgi:hypothetical protein